MSWSSHAGVANFARLAIRTDRPIEELPLWTFGTDDCFLTPPGQVLSTGSLPPSTIPAFDSEGLFSDNSTRPRRERRSLPVQGSGDPDDRVPSCFQGRREFLRSPDPVLEHGLRPDCLPWARCSGRPFDHVRGLAFPPSNRIASPESGRERFWAVLTRQVPLFGLESIEDTRVAYPTRRCVQEALRSR